MQVFDVSHNRPLGKSDHSVITFNYHCYLGYATHKYNYRKANYDGMKEHLEESNWNCNFVEKTKDKTVKEVWLSLKSKLVDLRWWWETSQGTRGTISNVRLVFGHTGMP